MRTFLSILLLACIQQIAFSSAVIGIDLGSEFVKVAVIKPGSGLDIVLNEQTKRKTVSYLGFRGHERYFGDDAYNLHTRFPKNMITYFKHLVGVHGDTASQWKQDYMFPYFALNSTERNTIKVHIDEKVVYTAEELLGMYLAMLKDMAEKHARAPVTNCMISVPAGYTPRQNQMIMDAAQLANLNILSLMHDTTAAALQFGVQQRGFKNTTRVVIFDMGSSKLEVGVFQYTPAPEDPDGSKAKKMDALGLGMLTVLATDSDMANGGRHYDTLLAKEIAKEFAAKSGVDVLAHDDLAGHKAVAKLMRSAQKAKETLSANKDARVAVEGIWDERDFNTVLSRVRFEELAAPLFERAIATFERAIAKAGLTVEDIDSVELMGGGSRIPTLQTKLKEAYGGKQLGRTLNTDEAIALGATFHGARLSGAFRVRSFALAEHHPKNLSFALSADESNPNPAIRPLFVESKYPSKKMITVFRKKNFNVSLYEDSTDPVTGEKSYTKINEYALQGVTKAFDKLGLNKEWVHPKSKHSLEIKFRLSDGGLVALDSAVAKYAEVVNTTKMVRIKPLKTKANATENATEAAEEEKEGKEEEKSEDKGEEKATEDEKKADDDTTTPEVVPDEDSASAKKAKKNATKEEPKYETINTTKVVNSRETLKVTTLHIQQPIPMGQLDFIDATYTLNKLSERDAAKLKIAEAKNELEAYMISTKYDGFFEDESLKEFIEESEGASIRTALQEVEEWLEEGEGVDASAAEYNKKLKYLKGLTAPIIKRKKDTEMEAAPLAEPEPESETSAPAEGSEAEANSNEETTSEEGEAASQEPGQGQGEL